MEGIPTAESMEKAKTSTSCRERGREDRVVVFSSVWLLMTFHFIPTHNARVTAPEVDLILVFVFFKRKINIILIKKIKK